MVETFDDDYFMRQALAEARAALDHDDVPVGAIVAEWKHHGQLGDVAEISIVVLESHRRKGIGAWALRSVEDLVMVDLEVVTLFALVRGDNQASKQLFHNAGYGAVGVGQNQDGTVKLWALGRVLNDLAPPELFKPDWWKEEVTDGSN